MMQVVIEISEHYYEILKYDVEHGNDYKPIVLIANATPLEKHDEEIIKETVESVWGKPPYTEVLDSIKAEIRKQNIADFIAVQSVLEIIDKYRKGQTE